MMMNAMANPAVIRSPGQPRLVAYLNRFSGL
jgi:hypothetical protein